MSYRSAEPYTMEATIQDLTTQKIRELFTLCGIGDTSDECINSVVSNISDYGERIGVCVWANALLISILVHNIRLVNGLGNAPVSPLPTDGLSPQTPPATPHEVRGSYRLLSYADKRGPAHFEGLAGRERKRRRHKKGSGFKNEGKKTSASPGDESVVTTETKLGNHIPLAADALGADRQNTNPVNLSTANPDSLGFEVVPRMETLSQSALERPLAALANNEGTNDPSSSEPPISSLPPWLDSGYAAKVVTTVLMNCVKLNSAMGLHGRQTMKPSITTDPSRIQQYTEAVSKLEYNEAVRVVKRDNAVAAGRTMQARLNETVYWDIILKGAKLIDPSALPIAKGPSDGFTSAEKAATRRFMEDAGYGIGAENQRQHRNLWKGLFQMRQEGISKFLAYRTQEFDSYCKTYPRRSATSLIDRVAQWEKVYGPHIEQLEHLVGRFVEGDVARRSCLENPPVVGRINIPGKSWNDADNAWFSVDEERSFRLTAEARAVSPDNLGVAFGGRSLLEDERDKSIFILLTPSDDRFLSVRPLIPLREGDFLGVFSGSIRFSQDFEPQWGIRGPDQRLWLDYSRVTGTLNQMRVSQPGGPANVQLHWELFGEDITEPRWSWRVSVRATRHIAPFEEIIRAAPHEEQYFLHQSAESAREGFMKRNETP